MNRSGCQETETQTPRERAKHLVLKVLGAKRVADWVGIEVDTVYQGLGRATDAAPVPDSWVGRIMAGAARAGMSVPLEVLVPAAAEAEGQS